jgi:hypothetical protein
MTRTADCYSRTGFVIHSQKALRLKAKVMKPKITHLHESTQLSLTVITQQQEKAWDACPVRVNLRVRVELKVRGAVGSERSFR